MHRATLAALRGTALALATGLGGALEAQETSPAEERCRAVMKIVSGVVTDYTGQISADLIADLQRKIGEDGKCNGPDQYRIWPNTKDREALNRIGQLIRVWDACKKDPVHEGCKETGGQ
jgi:hypothetical protein